MDEKRRDHAGSRVPVDPDATDGLIAHSRGNRKSAETLLPLVYSKLRALAGCMMREERAGHTLEPTALVHEAYMRLIDRDRIDWNGKTHFYAVAARQMRRVLVDNARKRGAQKRGQKPHFVTLQDQIQGQDEKLVEVLALHEALEKLGHRNERRGRVAELRLFAGLRFSEIAHVVQVSERTAKEDWAMARAWLMRELSRSS